MIPGDGRVLPGLDEFMLRTGHLWVLCECACSLGGGARKIQSEVQSIISTPTAIPDERIHSVGEYLSRKKLCRTRDAKDIPGDGDTREFKYPRLEVCVEADGSYVLNSLDAAERTIEWQDICISDLRVRSKVGALARAGKSGSKSGVSHIYDWAEQLELIDSSGQPTPTGRLYARAGGFLGETDTFNPYAFGPAVLIVAFQYFSRDLDLFAKLGALLLAHRGPIKKAAAREMFGEALIAVCAELEISRSASGTATYAVFQQLRDLERAARKSRTEIGATSTAWHRAASRLESLVDFGLLVKKGGGEDSQYQYVYSPAEGLQRAVAGLHQSDSAEEWLDTVLISVLYPDIPTLEVDSERLVADIDQIVEMLNLPTTLVPVDTLMLGIASLYLARGRATPLGSIRNAIEHLGISMPDRARLSRGTRGSHAEYVSWQRPRRR